ncbi:Uncharacterised protein [Legionella spiritensis]|nr:Uncharacterised protein [Legionella spiritensis]
MVLGSHLTGKIKLHPGDHHVLSGGIFIEFKEK